MSFGGHLLREMYAYTRSSPCGPELRSLHDNVFVDPPSLQGWNATKRKVHIRMFPLRYPDIIQGELPQHLS